MSPPMALRDNTTDNPDYERSPSAQLSAGRKNRMCKSPDLEEHVEISGAYGLKQDLKKCLEIFTSGQGRSIEWDSTVAKPDAFQAFKKMLSRELDAHRKDGTQRPEEVLKLAIEKNFGRLSSEEILLIGCLKYASRKSDIYDIFFGPPGKGFPSAGLLRDAEREDQRLHKLCLGVRLRIKTCQAWSNKYVPGFGRDEHH
ncbi:hypothetical protein BCR34DRAFT_667827, partial [Clohesyomyces aquaticus]